MIGGYKLDQLIHCSKIRLIKNVKWEIFVVSREPQKLKSAKYFPSLTICLFIQSNSCVFICVSITANKTTFFRDNGQVTCIKHE